MQNEDTQRLARKIARQLDERVSSEVVQALATARQRALASYRSPVEATGNVLALASPRSFLWMGLLVLMVVFSVVATHGVAPDDDEQEAHLLADELPVEAFIDPAFELFGMLDNK